MVHLIRSKQPSIVWVGLGAPKQDFWMSMYSEALAPSVLIGVGAAFDFSALGCARARRNGCATRDWSGRTGSHQSRAASHGATCAPTASS